MEITTAERYASGGPAKDLYAQNFPLAFHRQVERLGDAVAIRSGDDTLTWDELRAKVSRIAGGLASLGLKKGDTIALMMNNRIEFIPCDLGAVSLGAVPFSVYQTSSPEQIEYLLSDSEARIAIVETAFLDRVLAAKEKAPTLETVIVVDGDGGTHTLEELEALNPEFDVGPFVHAIKPDDFLTLIYTSGTTGPPKGVQLSHRNLMTLTAGVEDIVEFPETGGKVISWLPAAHIAERGAHYYLPMSRGLEVAICPNPREIIAFLPQVRPAWFFSVPRIWEKLKAGLEASIEKIPGEEGEKARAALQASLKKVRLENEGAEVPEELAAAVAAADEGMFSKLRDQLGLDKVMAVNAGAAPTSAEVLEFFHAIGVPVGELWGMSETCGVITCNPPDSVKIGTVGPPIAGAEVKLAEDGEILVRGEMVMPGYRNLAEKNEEAFTDDGWLLTGDIGELDEDGYLKIVDRKKELIINAAGKNMSPANIEAKLKLIPLVDQAVAIGDRRKFVTALITLDPEAAAGWAKAHGIDDPDLAELAEDETLLGEIESGVEEANSGLSRVEQVKRFKILPAPWDPGGDELTPTMKLKRRPIADKYAEEIEALYAE
jgi:long-subunit acyl-CoA synthetase (AMP-forming)